MLSEPTRFGVHNTPHLQILADVLAAIKGHSSEHAAERPSLFFAVVSLDHPLTL
jgi:hypothetical protein